MCLKKLTNKIIMFVTAVIILSICIMPTSAFAEEHENMVENIIVGDGFFLNEFEPDVYYYDVYLSKFTYNLSIVPELTDERFEYTIQGDDTINAEGDSGNLVTVTISDPLGKFETVDYELNIFVGADALENIKWTGLSYLDVENGIFSPQFSRYRITYYAILENEIDTFDAANVNWLTINPDASVEVECRDELNEDGTIPEGSRVEYRIRVTEMNGKSKSYYLNLYRKAQITSSISDTAVLSQIKINGGAVPVNGLSGHKSYYEVSVPNTITNLDIQAYPADRSDIVRVFGPTSMVTDGPVFVNILVTSPSEDTFSIYTLRLEYDSFIYTERYTSFQMILYLIIACGLGLFLGLFIKSFIFKKRKKSNNEEYEQEENKGIEEYAENENVPMV